MANNRMWLVHKPTMLGVRLGKRMSGGWYGAGKETGFDIQALFDAVEKAQDSASQYFSMDDFCVALEYCSDNNTGAIADDDVIQVKAEMKPRTKAVKPVPEPTRKPDPEIEARLMVLEEKVQDFIEKSNDQFFSLLQRYEAMCDLRHKAEAELVKRQKRKGKTRNPTDP